MRRTAVLIIALALVLPATAAAHGKPLRWKPVPTGSDVSYDGARNWTAFDAAPYDAVDCVPGTCWASGPDGAVAVLVR